MAMLDQQHSVLMYSPDSIGLGHMRRNSAIAAGLSRVLPGVSNLLLVGSSAGAYFDLPAGTDCIKLPSILKTGRNEWVPKSLNVPREVARNLRSRIITETAEAFAPDVFLVDHVPSGIWDELAPTLRSLSNASSRPQLVLGLRDILGAPKDICERWTADGIYDLIDDNYDKILIYGSPDIFPACEAYGLRKRFSDRIKYCGFIQFGRPPITRTDARRMLSIGNKPLVVMTAGGGHDAFPMMHFVLKALLTGQKLRKFDLTVVAGPLMPAAERQEIEIMAAELGASFLASTPNLHTYLSAADTILTMGGYNTVMEAIAVGVPTIVIPRIGPSAEQRYRAKQFSDLNLVHSIDLETSHPEELRDTIDFALSSPRKSISALSFDGIENAAHELASLARQGRVPRSPAFLQGTAAA
jgi:predicted glycosyltransferase